MLVPLLVAFRQAVALRWFVGIVVTSLRGKCLPLLSTTVYHGMQENLPARLWMLFLRYIAGFTREIGRYETLLEVVLVGEAGIEPTTYGLEGRCSIRLSYSPTRWAALLL